MMLYISNHRKLLWGRYVWIIYIVNIEKAKKTDIKSIILWRIVLFVMYSIFCFNVLWPTSISSSTFWRVSNISDIDVLFVFILAGFILLFIFKFVLLSLISVFCFSVFGSFFNWIFFIKFV